MPGRRSIPHTIVRTCSDYLHSPVVRNRADGTWAEGEKPEYDMPAGGRCWAGRWVGGSDLGVVCMGQHGGLARGSRAEGRTYRRC